MLVALIATASANAAVITWSAPRTIVDDLDVSTDGALVVAHNLGSFDNPSAMVNGVTFTPFVTSTPVNTTGNVTLSAATTVFGRNTGFGEIFGPFAALSTDYQALLESASFTGSATAGAAPAMISLALNGLTPGAQYQFQWWANQSDPASFDPLAPAPAVPFTTATAGNSVTLNRTGFGPDNIGQFALGVFTADASASQAITFAGPAPRNLVNAFQLRQLNAPTVPEPGSCIFGFALAGFVFRSASCRHRTRIHSLVK